MALAIGRRAKPGELAFASGGPGSSLHIAIEVLKRAAHINVTYVPFGGTAPAVNALMGNHVTAVWADYPTVVSQLKAGTLRGLVTTSATRVEALLNVPTLGETGISKYEADIFYGIVCAGEDAARHDQGTVRLVQQSAQGPRHGAQACPAGNSFQLARAARSSAPTCSGSSMNTAASFARRISQSSSAPCAGDRNARRPATPSVRRSGV